MATWKEVSLLWFTVILVIGSGKCYMPNFSEDQHNHVQPSRDIRQRLDSIPQNAFNEALDFGKESAQRDDNFEENILASDITLRAGDTPAFKSFLELLPNDESRNVDNNAEIVTKSSKYLVNKYCSPRQIDDESCVGYLSSRQLPEKSEIRGKCKKADANSFDRLLPANYDDGVHEISKNLPLPRGITSKIKNSDRAQHVYSDFNLMVIQWAQFIEYDLSRPVAVTKNNGDPVNCCTSDGYILQPRKRHPSCAPLLGDEPDDGIHFKTCQNYVRHAKTFNENCTFGSAVMLNQENGELDLSPLYGSQFREYSERLSVAATQQLASVSSSKYFSTSFGTKSGGNKDEFSTNVDWRLNNNPLIAQLTAMFLTSHLGIAMNSRSTVPSGEQLLNYARARNIDRYVDIIFNWWLPTILGEEAAMSVVNSRPENYRSGKISSEFAVAVMRFYLSMMPDMMPLKKSCMDGTLELSQNMHATDFWYHANCSESILLESMLSTNAHKVDLYYNPIILDNWLRPKNGTGGGLNCLAMDIQKGRDHGLAGYTKYLAKCSNKRISQWSDLEEFIEPKELSTIRSMYENINDVDLLIGGMSEKPTNGLLGTTFSCILADQFSKLWHNLGRPPKIQMLSGTTAAKFVCDTVGVRSVPQNIFKVVSERNPLLKCSTLTS